METGERIIVGIASFIAITILVSLLFCVGYFIKAKLNDADMSINGFFGINHDDRQSLLKNDLNEQSSG